MCYIYFLRQLITKLTFIIPSISIGWKPWSVNHTSMNDNSKLIVLKKINFGGEILSRYANDLSEINAHELILGILK